MQELHNFSWKRSSAQGGSKYDWDQILNGSVWEMKRGEDFTSKPHSMLTYIRAEAKKRGMIVRTVTLDEQTIIVQAVDSKTTNKDSFRRYRRVSDEERLKIINAFKAGESKSSIAKRFDRSTSLVHKILAEVA